MPAKQIGPDTFEVQPLPALRSFTLQPRLAPALAEAIGIIGGGIDGDMDVAKLAPAVGAFFAKLPPAEMESIIRDLLSTASVSTGNGGMMPLLPVFDIKMQCRALDTWRLLAFAIEVNYPDFFALFAANAASRKAANDSEASSISPGSAGDSSSNDGPVSRTSRRR